MTFSHLWKLLILHRLKKNMCGFCDMAPLRFYAFCWSVYGNCENLLNTSQNRYMKTTNNGLLCLLTFLQTSKTWKYPLLDQKHENTSFKKTSFFNVLFSVFLQIATEMASQKVKKRKFLPKLVAFLCLKTLFFDVFLMKKWQTSLTTMSSSLKLVNSVLRISINML